MRKIKISEKRAPRVGIPRALLYYSYNPFWTEFFRQIGAEPILSPETNKEILDAGVRLAVDEACLPVKVFLGHVQALINLGVDYLFIPRLVAVEKRAYICPKFLGLPDMARACLKLPVPLLKPTINLNGGRRQLWLAAREAAGQLGVHPIQAGRALLKAWVFWQKAGGISWWRQHTRSLRDENSRRGLKVAVIAHPYNLYDNYINLGLLQHLEQLGVEVVTPEDVPIQEAEAGAAQMPKRLFWTLNRHLLGTALHLAEQEGLSGLIHLSAFGCGPDSFTGEIITRRLQRAGRVSVLNLTIDEHSGEAGLVTRVEAFIDMLQRRRKQCGA
ncbi:MAG: acyl-CoA dehydratase activase-related protein [Bacillota bacterium]